MGLVKLDQNGPIENNLFYFFSHSISMKSRIANVLAENLKEMNPKSVADF